MLRVLPGSGSVQDTNAVSGNSALFPISNLVMSGCQAGLGYTITEGLNATH